MKNQAQKSKIIALILVVVMCLGIIVGCVPNIDNGDNTGNSGNTNQGNNDSNDNGGNGDTNGGGEGNENNPDAPHTCSFGDWTVIKSATATEDGLCERYCECGKVEQKVIPASAKEYTITYIDAPRHNNPTKYTVNDFVDLQAAVWNGLSFAYWSDKDGNIVEEIPYGTEGNITLYANWRYTENLAVSNKTNNILLSYYNDELNAHQFVYQLGTINNVVLDELSAYRYNGATNHTWSISETVSFTESDAQNVASTITKSVTSSSSWSSTTSATQSQSSSFNGSISAELSAGWAGTKASISTSLGVGNETGSSDTTSNSSSSSSGSSSGESNTVSSTLTFVSDTSTQITRSETLEPAISPAGLYRYVQAGEIQVYAVVTYDITTKNYYINIFSYVVRTYDTMLYEPIPEYNNNLNIVESEPFSFDLNIEGLAENIINNSYYIKFDANGGEGTMSTQMVLPNESTKLLANNFTKEGSLFVGWRVKDGDKTVVYTDCQSIKNLGSAGETVTLEAIWTKDPEYDKDVVYTLTTKNGNIANSDPERKYSAIIEYRNRTKNSIEIRIIWTTTVLTSAGWYINSDHLTFGTESAKSKEYMIIPRNTWPQYSNAPRSKTGETGWLTISLDTSQATSIDLDIYYCQRNEDGVDMTEKYGWSGVKETWIIDIPEY